MVSLFTRSSIELRSFVLANCHSVDSLILVRARVTADPQAAYQGYNTKELTPDGLFSRVAAIGRR